MSDYLTSLGWNPHLATFIAILLGVVACASFGLVWFTLIGLWVERKGSARVQDRMGPNRVGPNGLFQVFADLGKMITKEDITPEGADKPVYNIAPLLAIAAVVLIWAVVPFSKDLIGADLNVGAIYFISVASLGTLAILLAGWSSNNKYALLGALRAVAALVSYEIPMVLSILVPVMLAGTMSMQGIVEAQNIWYIFIVPLAGFIFFTSNLAETGRSPFDLVEAESELVAGYNIEYTGIKFGMFQAAEFVHSFTSGALFAVLFLGGWRGPGADQPGVLGALLGFGYFFGKAMVMYMVTLFVRFTIPRLRIDQMMAFNWKFLVPLQMVALLAVAFVMQVVKPDYAAAQQVAGSGGFLGALYSVLGPGFVADLPRGIALLLVNVIILAGVGLMIQNAIRKERAAVEGIQSDPPARGGNLPQVAEQAVGD
jgi:NADH-quinone oxidoreductase subunit H